MTRVSGLTQQLADNAAFRSGYDRAQSYVRIGMTLRGLREAKELTQRELAELAGLDQAEVSRIENGRWGKRGISFDVLGRILPVFGLRLTRAVESKPATELAPEVREAGNRMTALLGAE